MPTCAGSLTTILQVIMSNSSHHYTVTHPPADSSYQAIKTGLEADGKQMPVRVIKYIKRAVRFEHLFSLSFWSRNKSLDSVPACRQIRSNVLVLD